MVPNHRSWTVGEDFEFIIPSTLPGNLDLFRHYYAWVIKLLERRQQALKLQYDIEEVKEEWRRWSSVANAYTQVGVNIIRLDKI